MIAYLPHTSTNMATPIALPTSRIPRAAALHEAVTAIIKLTPERALELLELMREITARARYSSKAFKISSFEPNALYVPSYTLIKRPAPGDFLILENDFLVTSITPVKVIHADVMPFYVTWEAYDVNERFKLTTAELDCEVLKAIARGHSLPPDSNSHTIKNATRLSSGIFNMTKDWPTIH